MSTPGRSGRAPSAGRVAAIAVAVLAALCVTGAVADRLTWGEWVGFAAAVVVFAVAALWLRRDRLGRGRQQ